MTSRSDFFRRTNLRLALFCIVAWSCAANADDFRFVKIERAAINWRDVQEGLAANLSAGAQGKREVKGYENYALLSAAEPRTLAAINKAVKTSLPWVATSAVPVLLPFDLKTYLRDSHHRGGAKELKTYFIGGITSIEGIDAGISGYDARLIGSVDGKARSVTVSASKLVYDVDTIKPEVREVRLAGSAGGLIIRDYIVDDERRFAFDKFGVTYVLSAYCSSATRAASNCDREAQLLTEVAKALQFVGGHTSVVKHVNAKLWPRPLRRQAQTFRFHPPGALLPGTGQGRPDYTVYALIRFPLNEAPAFANSQVFMDGGNCLNTRLNLVGDVPEEPFVPYRTNYNCEITGSSLSNDEGSVKNYQYPWRDNFCEQRSWNVSSCPGGVGHQGQDIRPARCNPASWRSGEGKPGIERCKPFVYRVVAVADGTVHRFDGAETLNFYVNAMRQRFKVRYLHMDPATMDVNGLKSGRKVHRGDVLGELGNYLDGPYGTSSHLHFELFVPTRFGWARVNPYASLIVSYERLIGERGREVAGQ